MIKVVCRESVVLLDPPHSGGGSGSGSGSGSGGGREGGLKVGLTLKPDSHAFTVRPRKAIMSEKEDCNEVSTDDGTDIAAERERKSNEIVTSQFVSHPAALSPLLATQDSCLKILSILSTLLGTAGCALLLRSTNAQDQSTNNVRDSGNVSTDTIYQAICTGDGLSWYDLEPGVFGTITIQHTPHRHSPYPVSLIESCLLSGRILTLKDASADIRYCHRADGSCMSECPYMVVPVRGRDGLVVGVIVAARRRGSQEYSQVS